MSGLCNAIGRVIPRIDRCSPGRLNLNVYVGGSPAAASIRGLRIDGPGSPAAASIRGGSRTARTVCTSHLVTTSVTSRFLFYLSKSRSRSKKIYSRGSRSSSKKIYLSKIRK